MARRIGKEDRDNQDLFWKGPNYLEEEIKIAPNNKTQVTDSTGIVYDCIQGQGYLVLHGHAYTLLPGTIWILEENETHALENAIDQSLVLKRYQKVGTLASI